jgi:Putative amidoligase enzyme
MKIQDLTPPVAVPEPAWKQQLVEFWQQADDHHKIDLEVTLKMGDAAGARKIIESWQQEVVERKKKKSRPAKKKKSRVRYGYGGYWTPGFNFGGTELGGEGGGDGGGGGESVREASTPDGVSASTKMFLEQDAGSVADVIQDFVGYCVDQLGITQAPRLQLRRDPAWSERNRSFGRFDPATNRLDISTADRHVMDVLRTVAHELVHHHQQEQQDLPPDAGETGSKYENEANARAGQLMRDYGRSHPELFGSTDLEEDWKQRLGGAALAAACAVGTPGCATTSGLQAAQAAATAAQTFKGRDLKGVARAELEQELKNYARAQRGDANAQNLSRIYQAQRRAQQNESSGYIPTEREKNDPRFSMALSPDVRPGATGKNANKMALKTGPQGEPQLLIKGLKNALREFKETGGLPLTEDQDLFEINMSPGNLERLVRDIDARAGIEFEMIVPNVNVEDGDDEQEPDYDYDERVSSISDAEDFFLDGDHNSRRDVQGLVEAMGQDYYEWAQEQIDEDWDNEGQEYLRDYIDNNELFDRDDHLEAAQEYVREMFADEEEPVDEQSDRFLDAVTDRLDAMADEFVESEWDDRGNAYDYAKEQFDEEKRDDYEESQWLRSQGLNYMSNVYDRYSDEVQWPYWQSVGGDREMDIDSVADDFSEAIGRPVNASSSYHGGRREAGHYVVEPDSSLDPDDNDDGGLEFVSPPLPLDELLSDMDKVREWAKKRGCYTNNSTGLHMNVSVPDTSTAKLDYVKLALLLGDERVLSEFGRSANTYAKSALGKIRTILQQKPEAAQEVLNKMREHMGALATKVIHTGNTDKYTSINTKGNYVEFRSPGGDWLDANWDRVKPTLLRTVVALDAAMDPAKYRQEYQKKLYKLLNPQGLKDEYGDMLREFSDYMSSLQGGQSEPGQKLSSETQQAIRDFRKTTTQKLKQSNLSRDLAKGKIPAGQKYWWSVSRPGYFASIEVVADSKEEAIAKAIEPGNYPDWASAQNSLEAKPLRPYKEQQPRLSYNVYDARAGYNRSSITASSQEEAIQQFRQFVSRENNPHDFNLIDSADRVVARGGDLQQPATEPGNGNWGIWITNADRFANQPGEYARNETPPLYRFASREAAEQWIEQSRTQRPNMRTDIEVREIEPSVQNTGSTTSGNWGVWVPGLDRYATIANAGPRRFETEAEAQAWIEDYNQRQPGNDLELRASKITNTFRAFDVGNGNTVGRFQASGPAGSRSANVAFSQYMQSLGRTNTAGFDYDEAESDAGEFRSTENVPRDGRPTNLTPRGPGPWEIYRISNGETVRELSGTHRVDAEQEARNALGLRGEAPELYGVRTRGAQPAAASGEFTGEWKIVDSNGQEIHRFGGVGNVQADANNVAIRWLQQNPRHMQAGVEVVPVMSE